MSIGKHAHHSKDEIVIPDLISELQSRLSSHHRTIERYKAGPKDTHTICFIAISEAQIDELRFVIDRLQTLCPSPPE